MIKYLLKASIFLFTIVSLNAQNYDIQLNRTSVNCSSLQVCYDVQLRPISSSPFNLGGQNYRVYYNSLYASYISGTSVLPSQYGSYTLIQDVQNADASGQNGPLSFEETLGFLNFGIDLNDLQSGGIILPEGQWSSTANLCFIVTQEVIDDPNICLEMVWGREDLTSDYATAYVEVSNWVSNNTTTDAIINEYIDLNQASGDAACFNFACAMPTVSISALSIIENAGQANLQVCLSSISVLPVTVTLNTFDVTAVSIFDYEAISNDSVIIPAGQLCSLVSIPIIDDNIAEGNETFIVTLLNPTSNATLGNYSDTITIIDNETFPHLSINNISVNENAGVANLTVNLTGPSVHDITVTINTQNVTAIAPEDYSAITNQIFTIPAGDTSLSFSIPVIDDNDVEGNETFSVIMFNPVNANISTATSTILIIDNDVTCGAVAPVISGN